MLEPLLDIALDLCANLAAEDRYRRLMAAVRRMVPCDAAAVLELRRDGVLVPVVVAGLQPDVVGRRFPPAEHPRLLRLLAAEGPVRFTGSPLPDPFDGLVTAQPDALTRVHACMGCPLRRGGEVIGVLTVDALDPHAFDALTDQMVATLAALAGAAMRTAGLVDALERAATHQGLVARQLQSDRPEGGSELLGASAAIQRIRGELELLAASDLPVLITGETGVGKEVVARSLHARSSRREQPLIQVNCAALPEFIVESELFGHVRGAFTGATDHRAGKFEVADGGTLFLDEVGELPLSVQPKLLRALQSGEVQRVGSDRALKVDVRMVAATNRDLAGEVRAGRFRADLFHRLAVYPIHVPPLRERPEDVELLAGYFLDRARARLGLGPVRMSPAAREALATGDWPGNVRELEHTLLRAALRASGGRRRETVVLDAAHLGLGAAVERTAAAPGALPSPSPGTTLREALDALQRRMVEETLQRLGGNLSAAARELGVDRANLYRLVQRMGLRKPGGVPAQDPG